MAEYQVLHEVGEMNLQQPNVQITEAEQQALQNRDQKDDKKSDKNN